MPGEIITYEEMCRRESTRLQKGINFDLGSRYSIVLTSRMPDAPYNDEFQDNDTVLIYEGHDMPKKDGAEPKLHDQPERTPKGTLTQNGKFHEAARQFKQGDRTAERVKVYENLKTGKWVYHGMFLLTDSWIKHDGKRNVFKFKLEAVIESQFAVKTISDIQRRHFISSKIIAEVLERDGRKCTVCGSMDNLSIMSSDENSITVDNILIVCDKHDTFNK